MGPLVTSFPRLAHAIRIDADEPVAVSRAVSIDPDALVEPSEQKVKRLRPLRGYGGPPLSFKWRPKPVGLGIHYTGSPEVGGLRWLLSKAARASVHFGIDRKGTPYQLLPLNRAAAHAGVSSAWLGDNPHPNANRFLYGVELCNAGLLHKMGDSFYYEVGRTLKRYNPARYGEPVTRTLRLGNYDTGIQHWAPYTPEQIETLLDLTIFLHLREGRERLRFFGPEQYTTTRWGYNESHETAFTIYGHDTIARPTGRKLDPGPLFPWEMFSLSAQKILEYISKEDGR